MDLTVTSIAQDATERSLESRAMDLAKEDLHLSAEIKQKAWTVFQQHRGLLTQQPSKLREVMDALVVAAVCSMPSRCSAKTGPTTRSAFLANHANDHLTVFLPVTDLIMISTVEDVMENHLVPRDMALLVVQDSFSVETSRTMSLTAPPWLSTPQPSREMQRTPRKHVPGVEERFSMQKKCSPKIMCSTRRASTAWSATVRWIPSLAATRRMERFFAVRATERTSGLTDTDMVG